MTAAAGGVLPARAGASAVRALLLALAAAAGTTAFAVLRPSQAWVLWFTAGVVALGVDGLVRSHPHWTTRGWWATWVYLLLPALAVVAGGYFAREALDGFARPALAGVFGVFVGLLAFGEYYTVEPGSRLYGPLRLLLAIGCYLVAFGLFTVLFAREVELPLAALVVGLVSMGLAIELLRESQILGVSSLLAGFAVGVTMGELRLALYFFPLDAVLGGAILVVGFYVATGVVHHLLEHDLSLGTLLEYVIVAGMSTAAIVLTRLLV